MSGLADTERAELDAWWHSDWPDDGGEVLDTLAETVERILAARGDALAGKVRALADGWERVAGHDRDVESKTLRGVVIHLRALLDADPDPDARPPLPERVDAVIRRSRNLREGLVEAIQSGELAP